MLREEVIKELEEEIKTINREKDLEIRLQLMIKKIEEVRIRFNDELDEIFSAVNLKRKKLNLDDLEIL